MTIDAKNFFGLNCISELIKSLFLDIDSFFLCTMSRKNPVTLVMKDLYWYNAQMNKGLTTKTKLFITMDESFTKHLPFSLLTKNLKKQSFEVRSLNHSGKDQFDPVLAKQGGGAKD